MALCVRLTSGEEDRFEKCYLDNNARVPGQAPEWIAKNPKAEQQPDGSLHVTVLGVPDPRAQELGGSADAVRLEGLVAVYAPGVWVSWRQDPA